MAVNSLTIRPLEDATLLANFHCGIQAMDDFIHSGLNESIRNHYCNSYSVSLGSELVAMFALGFDSLELDSDPYGMQKIDAMYFTERKSLRDWSDAKA